MLNEFAPPPWPRSERYVGAIRDGRLVIRPGCRRVITDHDGNIRNESLIGYAVLDPHPGDRLMLIAFSGEAIGIYRKTKDGISLEHGTAVDGECVVMKVAP